MSRRTLIPLLIIVVTAATFARVIGNDFVSWDDRDTIAQNPRLNPPSLHGAGYYWHRRA